MTESHYVKAIVNISVNEVSQATGTLTTFIAIYRTYFILHLQAIWP